jgi:hypothetical protein
MVTAGLLLKVRLWKTAFTVKPVMRTVTVVGNADGVLVTEKLEVANPGALVDPLVAAGSP